MRGQPGGYSEYMSHREKQRYPQLIYELTIILGKSRLIGEYTEAKDVLDPLAPYVWEGLAAQELCLCLYSRTHDRDEMLVGIWLGKELDEWFEDNWERYRG